MQQENFKKYVNAFAEKLAVVSIDGVSTETYCKKYLAHILGHKKYYLHIYADVLNKLVLHSSIDKTAISLVDYGAGNGLLGIFAKACGFGKVFINDMDLSFVSSSKKLAEQLGITIDGFITGSINEMQQYFKHETPTAVIGTDVIEHIYDLGFFFKTLKNINPSMASVFTTASNPSNYFKVRKLRKLQLKDELEGGVPDDHLLFGETALEPFIKTRENIIREHAQDLPEVKILLLARATRGMNIWDIQAATDHFSKCGELPQPAEDTNTCNPLNGSWTERLLSLDTYRSLYHAAGFEIRIYDGFYNVYETGIKKIVKKLLNGSISVLRNRISPYLVIVGFKK